jgi:hypothetical protein
MFGKSWCFLLQLAFACEVIAARFRRPLMADRTPAGRFPARQTAPQESQDGPS